MDVNPVKSDVDPVKPGVDPVESGVDPFGEKVSAAAKFAGVGVAGR
jgi:hypothetical protein